MPWPARSARLLGLAALLLTPLAANASSSPKHTAVSIVGDTFHINGRPTYEGRTWQGHKVEGLLLNSRMVQGTFDDLNPATAPTFAYPDTGRWDPERNTREFLDAMPEWRRHGLLALTLNLQGGSPEGYSKGQPWHNSAFRTDGSLRPEFMGRLGRILDRADELGMVVILGLYYFGQDQRLEGEDAVVRGVDNAIDWILDRGDTHVLIEVNNECNNGYDHAILRPDRVHELIERVKSRARDGRRLLVSASYGGGKIPGHNVVRAADFLLIHGNGVSEPSKIAEMVRKTRQVPGYRPMPILFNEDDHFDFDKPDNNLTAAVGEYASWGYFDPGQMGPDGKRLHNYVDGYQSPPVNWSINTDRKREFFRLVAAITGADELEKTDLYQAGQDGYAIYRIPSLVVTKQGTVLTFCEARRTSGDWADIDVLERRSTDGGQTFEPPVRLNGEFADVAPNPRAPKNRQPADRTVGNPVPIADPVSGVVHLLHCVDYHRAFYRRSDDDGRTWSDPVDITPAFDAFRPEYDWRVLATGPGHGIRLKNGRLVVAVWLSTATGSNAHHPSVAATIFSDDDGRTWHRGAIAVPATDEHLDPNETSLAQLSDGRVLLNTRNQSTSRRRLLTTSPDGATSWTPPEFAPDLSDPVCMGSMLGLGEGRLLFANLHKPVLDASPLPDPLPKGWNARENLTLRLSADNGRTWPVARVLEPGPSAYSDLAARPDGTILCLYERGSASNPSPYARLTLARIPAGWIRATANASPIGPTTAP
jgi:hypothetical protein